MCIRLTSSPFLQAVLAGITYVISFRKSEASTSGSEESESSSSDEEEDRLHDFSVSNDHSPTGQKESERLNRDDEHDNSLCSVAVTIPANGNAQTEDDFEREIAGTI